MFDISHAEKLRAQIQGDVERGVFQLEKYLSQQTDVVPYLNEWLQDIEGTVAPGTWCNYRSCVRNHIIPFFEKNTVCLHEIQHDVLMRLLKSIDLQPKGKYNVMMCLHACLDYAWRSRRIEVVPPFPKKSVYQLVDPVIHWIPEDRQMNIINAIPEEHRPIFLWLKYHMRRPAEAMTLRREDYDPQAGVFTIQRGISANQEVHHTKTRQVHYIPCHSEFKTILDAMPVKYPFSPYLFTCDEAENTHKRYTRNVMGRIWKEACKAAGESISLYSGLKHSTVTQYLHAGYSFEELRVLTDHASVESTKKYASLQMAQKKALMEGKLLRLKSGSESGMRKARKS